MIRTFGPCLSCLLHFFASTYSNHSGVSALNAVCMNDPVPQAAAEARLPAAAAAAITAEASPTTSSKDIYPSDQATASGVYSLLDFGCVPPEHPEHPDTFIPEMLKVVEKEEKESAATGVKGRWTFRRPRRSRDTPIAQAVHHPSGVWASGFGTALEDVYRDRGTVSPCFTTKTRCVSHARLLADTGIRNTL